MGRVAGLRGLLWLLVALLPLRGWAFATMHLEAPDVAPPCHAAAPLDRAPGGMAPDASARDDAAPDRAAAPCALCDLCHGAMLALSAAPSPPGTPEAQPLPAASPAAAPAADADPPFRPPRR